MKIYPALAALICLGLPYLALAVETAPEGSAVVAPVKPDKEDAAPTPEEKAEKEGRNACKVDLCGAFHGKGAAGSKVACHLVKSWRKEAMTKLIAKIKVTWPYEGVRCSTDIDLQRDELAKATTGPKAEVQFGKQSVSCVINRDKEAPTELKVELSPKIFFEDGKAVKASANWGRITAPTLLKGALWTATAADNTVNMLSGSIVEEVNEFVSKKCDEVKDQWAGKP